MRFIKKNKKGERTLKASSEIESVYENGQIDSSSTTMGLYTTYVSPYMVVDADQKYSKHYFNGSQRVVSRIGNQTAEIFEESQLRTALAKNQTEKNETESTTDFDALKNKQIADLNYYLNQNTTTARKAKVKFKEFKKQNEESNSATSKEITDNEQEIQASEFPEMFYYHSDHLGTGTFLSDTYGNPYQFFLNLPFGETMIEQHSYSADYTNRYKFNGKELDEETGFYYYGARYYNPKFSIWLSVDPLAEIAPDRTPYHFCSNNPINRIDPTGMIDGWIEEKEGNKSTFTYRDGIDTVQQAKDAGFTNAVGVTPAHVVWNDKYDYSYNLNTDGSVTGCEDGACMEAFDNFTTKGGTTINFRNDNYWSDAYFNSGVLTPYEVRSQALEPNAGKLAEVTGNSLTVFEGIRNSKVGDLIRGNGTPSQFGTKLLSRGGKVLGGFGILNTGYQYMNGNITGAEAFFDTAFGVIGFMGPVGAAISLTYSLGKTGYELYTGKTLFDKPKK